MFALVSFACGSGTVRARSGWLASISFPAVVPAQAPSRPTPRIRPPALDRAAFVVKAFPLSVAHREDMIDYRLQPDIPFRFGRLPLLRLRRWDGRRLRGRLGQLPQRSHDRRNSLVGC